MRIVANSSGSLFSSVTSPAIFTEPPAAAAVSAAARQIMYAVSFLFNFQVFGCVRLSEIVAEGDVEPVLAERYVFELAKVCHAERSGY